MNFENRIRERFALSPLAGADAPLTGDLREIASAARLIGKPPEAFHVQVPLTGRFRGVDVSALEFLWGDRNGIYAASIVFREPIESVEAAIGPAVAAQQGELRALEQDLEAAARRGEGAVGILPNLSLGVVEGAAKLDCDWST